jgi:hypothetical protein
MSPPFSGRDIIKIFTEKLERLQEAKKCFRKAHSIGDLEGTAIIKLAKYVRHLYNILNLSKV